MFLSWHLCNETKNCLYVTVSKRVKGWDLFRDRRHGGEKGGIGGGGWVWVNIQEFKCARAVNDLRVLDISIASNMLSLFQTKLLIWWLFYACSHKVWFVAVYSFCKSYCCFALRCSSLLSKCLGGTQVQKRPATRMNCSMLYWQERN